MPTPQQEQDMQALEVLIDSNRERGRDQYPHDQTLATMAYEADQARSIFHGAGRGVEYSEARIYDAQENEQVVTEGMQRAYAGAVRDFESSTTRMLETGFRYEGTMQRLLDERDAGYTATRPNADVARAVAGTQPTQPSDTRRRRTEHGSRGQAGQGSGTRRSSRRQGH